MHVHTAAGVPSIEYWSLAWIWERGTLSSQVHSTMKAGRILAFRNSVPLRLLCCKHSLLLRSRPKVRRRSQHPFETSAALLCFFGGVKLFHQAEKAALQFVNAHVFR